jgi:hypothetical protein
MSHQLGRRPGFGEQCVQPLATETLEVVPAEWSGGEVRRELVPKPAHEIHPGRVAQDDKALGLQLF